MGGETSSEHEGDFELGDGVQHLHLAPSTLRKRPSSDLWDGLDESGGSDAKLRTNKSPAPSQRSFADSDNDGALGDDEGEAAEAIEDGLDLPESIFGKVDEAKETPSARLRALLDARLRGQHQSTSATPSRAVATSTSERLAGGALDFDADTDVVTGLVITDDLDLSPSRLVAKSLSFKTRRSIGGGSGVASHTIPRNQQTPSADRQRPSGTNVRTWAHSPSGVLPTVVLTNSSPAQHDRTTASTSQRSPPRALSSFSHAPGSGPRALTLVRGDPFRSSSPTGRGSGASRLGGNQSQTLLSPDAAISSSGYSHNLSQSQQRNKSLVRKRSMPALSDASASAGPTSTSAALSAVHASITASTSALSRLMAPTAASRAREAETAARLAARGSPERELHGSGSAPSPTAARISPSRPSTPVNGAVSHTLNTSGNRIRPVAAGAAAIAASAAAAAVSQREAMNGTGSPRLGSSGAQSRGGVSMYSAITASAAAAKNAARVMRRPTRPRNYGTGNELDAFDDLPTNNEVENRFRRTPLRQASSQVQQNLAGDETLKVRPRDLPNLVTSLENGVNTLKGNSKLYSNQNAVAGPSTQRAASQAETAASSAGTGTTTNRRRSTRAGANKSKKPTLIRNLGGNAQNRSRVVGDMRWNPAMQRWEGNESALGAFDHVVNSSSRPALISPLTTSSVSSLVSSSSSLLSPSPGAAIGGTYSVSTLGKSALTMIGLAAAARAAQLTSVHSRLKHTVSTPASTATSFVEPQGCLQGTRVVGDMMFDPVQMCWLSMVETEEPDVFAGIGDEDEAVSSSGEREGFSSSAGGRARRGSGLTGAGAWSSSWQGVDERRGRSSTAATTDEEDEMSKSVGGSDTGAMQLPPPASPSAYASEARSTRKAEGVSQRPVEGADVQQQTLTARRIRSADLLRTTTMGGRSASTSPVEPAIAVFGAATDGSSAVLAPRVDENDDDEELRKLCLEAEGRHRREVRGFLPKGATTAAASAGLPAASSLLGDHFGRPSKGSGGDVDPRSHLYLLQRLAREACR